MHTAGPVSRGGEQNEDQLLQDAYLNSLRLVAANSYTSVAFPAISTGVYGYPRAAAAEIAVKTVSEFITRHALPEQVYFVCYDEETPTSTKDSLPNKEMNDLPRLASAVLPLCSQHPGQVWPFSSGEKSGCVCRPVSSGRMAEHTLDVQYYIWQDDMSGRLLFSALLAAAKRGVRVRLLLDDNNTPGLDDILRLLDSHPRIEVRLFNPFSFRLLRPLGYITDFSRLNRRMHNKSFTVDGVVTLVGGRNIGDAYFGAGEEPLFSDLDVMAIGPW